MEPDRENTTPRLGILRAAVRLALRPEARSDAAHEWRRRLRGGPRPLPGPVRSALVVCHGNLCRSPFAAALLAATLPSLAVRSAGLEAGEGEPAAPDAVRAARRAGVDLSGHRTRRLDVADLSGTDLILGMEARHERALVRLAPEVRARVRLLGEFLAEPPFGIADPWGRSDPVFDATFARLRDAVERLARAIETASA
jgi:protein-tyrosine phosphatase